MGTRKWRVLPPRPIPWTMKPLSSAKTWERTLPDGRRELRIQHDLIRGVTPRMLAWWYRNIEGEMELGGKTYPRYLIWHPIDHVHYRVVRRLSDGSVGVGARFHVVEALGGDPGYLIDVVLHVRSLTRRESLSRWPWRAGRLCVSTVKSFLRKGERGSTRQ